MKLLKNPIFKNIIYLILLYFILFNCSDKKDEGKIVSPIEIKNYFSKTKPLIGDIVQYHLEIKYLKNIKVEIPDISNYLYNFTIKNYNIEEKEVAANYKEKKIIYYLTSYEDTTFIIPSIRIRYIANNETKEIDTKRLYIRFYSTNPDLSQDIRDIKNVVEIKTNYLLNLIIIIIISGIIIGGYKYYKKYKSAQIQIEEKKYTPYEWAKIRLKRLYEKDLVAQEKVKEYCFEITEILREYIGKIYNVNALDMTKEELLDYLRKRKINYMNEIKEYLYNTDMIKFAKYKPTHQEIDEITKTTENLIEEIKNEIFIKQTTV